MKGKYIGVNIPGDNKQLTLCEVEAYTIPSNRIYPIGAVQTGDYNTQTKAERAIDGKRDTKSCKYVNSNDNSITLTDNKVKNPYWRAEFAEEKTITYLEVFSRTDGYNYMDDFEVSVGNNPDPLKNPVCGAKNPWTNYTSLVVDCFLKGKYVGIFLKDKTTNLGFCEVEFYGY